MRSKKPDSNTSRPLWRVYQDPYHIHNVGLNSRAKIAQAMAETRKELQEAETDDERYAAAMTGLGAVLQIRCTDKLLIKQKAVLHL